VSIVDIDDDCKAKQSMSKTLKRSGQSRSKGRRVSIVQMRFKCLLLAHLMHEKLFKMH
jgi:hypothetical protein